MTAAGRQGGQDQGGIEDMQGGKIKVYKIKVSVACSSSFEYK